jgi:hypothetical protein
MIILPRQARDKRRDSTQNLTLQAFESMRPALRGGLSSRAIAGESGPLHLRDTFGVSSLELDAKLVPLYR